MISSFAPSYAGATSPHTGQFSRRRWISAQGLVPEFHDIDLTIADSNTDRAREILCEIRTLQSLTLQGEYYRLMGRTAKAELIQSALAERDSGQNRVFAEKNILSESKASRYSRKM